MRVRGSPARERAKEVPRAEWKPPIAETSISANDGAQNWFRASSTSWAWNRARRRSFGRREAGSDWIAGERRGLWPILETCVTARLRGVSLAYVSWAPSTSRKPASAEPPRLQQRQRAVPTGSAIPGAKYVRYGRRGLRPVDRKWPDSFEAMVVTSRRAGSPDWSVLRSRTSTGRRCRSPTPQAIPKRHPLALRCFAGGDCAGPWGAGSRAALLYHKIASSAASAIVFAACSRSESCRCT